MMLVDALSTNACTNTHWDNGAAPAWYGHVETLSPDKLNRHLTIYEYVFFAIEAWRDTAEAGQVRR